MGNDVKLGALEGFSYGWHTNANDIMPIRLLKALKTAVQGLFGRFTVKVFSAEVRSIVNEAPNSWFAIQLNKIYDRKVTPMQVSNSLSQSKSPGEESVFDLPKASKIEKRINEMKDLVYVENAITVLAGSERFQDYFSETPGVFEQFFNNLITKWGEDPKNCKGFIRQAERLMNLGFKPRNIEDENKIENIKLKVHSGSNDSIHKEPVENSSKSLEEIKCLENLMYMKNSDERLAAFNKAVAIAKNDPNKMERIQESSKRFLNAFSSMVSLNSEDPDKSDILGFLNVCNEMKKNGVEISSTIRKGIENTLQFTLEQAKSEIKDSEFNEKKYNTVEQLFSEFFEIFPEQSSDFHTNIYSMIHGDIMISTMGNADIGIFSILKNAGYNFNSDNFSMNPTAHCNPLVGFVTLLIEQFLNNDLERAKGFLGVGINLSSDQISEIRKYLASKNINETDEMTKAFEELSQPKEILKESEFLGDTESQKQLAELQSVLLDYEVGYPDKLKCFEKFERATENKKLSDEDCLKYNQMLDLFANKHYQWFMNITSDVKSLQDGFKLFNKIKKHNPNILDKYAYSIKGPICQDVVISKNVSHPAIVRLTGLLSLRGSVYTNYITDLKRFVNKAVKETTHKNANVDDSIEFLRVVMSLDRNFIGDESMAQLRRNLVGAVLSKDKREDDYINKMIGIGIKIRHKNNKVLDDLKKRLEENYPGATWTVNDIYEMPEVNK